MTHDHDEMLLRLPGTAEEQEWLEEHLEVLSVKERIVLAVAVERRPPAAMADAVNLLLSLNSYAAHNCSRGYDAQGDLILSEQFVPWEQRPFFDKAALGRLYEEQHPGQFIGNIYLEYPRDQYTLHYDGTDFPEAEAERWSVRLKLASEAVPEGVWIRLPDYDAAFRDDPGDIALAMDELGVELFQDCTLRDARCVLPCVQDLAGQYERIDDLVRAGQELGFLLDAQHSPEFFERLAVALEFEHCRRLDDALRISYDLDNYDLVSVDAFIDQLKQKLSIQRWTQYNTGGKEYFDHAGYAAALAEQQDYQVTDDGCYFIRKRDSPELEQQPAMTVPGQGGMGMM